MIEQKLNEFRDKLLDQSLHNRLLNFKEKGRQSLRVVMDSPADIYRLLVAERKTLSFLSHDEIGTTIATDTDPVGESAPAAMPSDGASRQPTDKQFLVKLITAPPHSTQRAGVRDPTAGPTLAGEAINSSPTSGELIRSKSPSKLATNLDAEALDTRLLFLAREAESALDEQGCNTLFLAFGLLDWTDAQSSAQSFMAPLVLVPVELTRRDARQRYRVKLVDDEPVLNPTLVEKCRAGFDIRLPEFNPESNFAIDEFFDATRQLLLNLRGRGGVFSPWNLRYETHLGLFAFTKLTMYRDLDPRQWPEDHAITRHPLVRGLCLGYIGDDAAEVDWQLLPPAHVDPHRLDELHPRETFQVLPADSTQQVAIVRAKRGDSMVIQGPPGTGKSQTIANIIAECLGDGKTVLFVAEKSAALDVVRRRLEKVGLAQFTLAMHSRKAGKRAILEELNRSLNAEPPVFETLQEAKAEELHRLRCKLNEYARRLHERVGALQYKRFDALGECARLRDAPEAVFALRDVWDWDQARLDLAKESVTRLAKAAQQVGDILDPWRGMHEKELALSVEQEIDARFDELGTAIEQIEQFSNECATCLGASPPANWKEAADVYRTAKAICEAPIVTATDVANPQWDTVGPDIERMVRDGETIADLRAQLKLRWQPSAEDMDWTLIRRRRSGQIRSMVRWFAPSWYRDTKLIRAHLRAGVDPTGAALVSEMAKLEALRGPREAFDASDAIGAKMFGELWRGAASDWRTIRRCTEAAITVRRLVTQENLTDDAARRVFSPKGRCDLEAVRSKLSAARQHMHTSWTYLLEALSIKPKEFLGDDPELSGFVVWRRRLAECRAALPALRDQIDLNRCQDRCQKQGLDTFLQWCETNGKAHSHDDWPRAFERQFFRRWVEEALRDWREFHDLNGDAIDTFVERFREVDRRWIELTQSRLAAKIAERRPQTDAALSKKVGILKAEAQPRRRAGKSIRRLFADTGEVIQRLKPCFMMSPMSVAQYLEPGKLEFDVVIFDEASQVEPADALGAVARSRQLILVGDDKQLPPTNFFRSVVEEREEDSDDDGPNVDLESVLAMGQVCLPRPAMLCWHYRSRHNSLIDFSNSEFYGGELRVFPSPDKAPDEFGVKFHHVPDGRYGRGRSRDNPIEAQAVAKAVLRHARETPELSLGVGAFSIAQQQAILDEIERMRKDEKDPFVEEFFERGKDDRFFVKNLETIQGDERDVIFLSIGYGFDDLGRPPVITGPLTRDNGWRRLNVLITRAERRCEVFSSVTADQIRVSDTTSRGVRNLRDYLRFAERGVLPEMERSNKDHDSPFEADVCRELRARGWEVDPQVGCAGFWIDLAVVDRRAPGKYIIGIECDGRTYHSSATARDRDRLRQDILVDRHWKIHRIWSTDWFQRRQQTLQKLLDRLDELATIRSIVCAPEPTAGLGNSGIPTQ